MTDTDQEGVLRKRSRGGGWTAVANSILVDPTLSWKAKGLLGYMLSRPDGWRFASRRIAEHGTDGKAAVQTGLRELRDAGLLRYHREQRPDGSFLWVYEVSDEVVPEWSTTARKSGSGTTARFSTAGKSGRSLTRTEKDPPSPPPGSGTSTPDGGGREDQIITAAIEARVRRAVEAGGLHSVAAFRRSQREELDTDEARSRVRRWLVDFPGATDSLYAGCLADGTGSALRGYARPDLDADLYAAHELPTESPEQPARPSLRLVAAPAVRQETSGG